MTTSTKQTNSSIDANTWNMFVHLSTLVGLAFPVGNIVAPLVLWQIKKNEMPGIEAHGKEATNFQISMTIYTLIAFFLAFIGIGIIILIVLAILDLVCTVKAALAARDGKQYHYPLTIQFIK